jgi:aryl-alcohol dehydrogenase-like predicted oxidoreductase
LLLIKRVQRSRRARLHRDTRDRPNQQTRLYNAASRIRGSVTQIALNWLLQRPTVASLIIGARNETQLSENFGAIGWALTPHQIQLLDKASRVIPTYPYWHQEGFGERNPFPAL